MQKAGGISCSLQHGNFSFKSILFDFVKILKSRRRVDNKFQHLSSYKATFFVEPLNDTCLWEMKYSKF